MITRRSTLITLAAVLVLLLTTGALWRISKARCFQLVGEVTCHVETSEKLVALSFDDGPTPEGVDAVLNQLEPRGIKATFFLIGDRMEKFPGQAERLAAAGMELGNHSYSHARMLGRSQSFYAAEIARTDALLTKAGRSGPRLFRPPFGKRLIGLPIAVDRAGYQTIMWNVEDDAKHYPDPQSYADDIVSRVRPGSIILIHQMYRTNQVERAALPLILDALTAKGYRIVTVGELLANGPETNVER